ncbi:MAG: bifunctional UDP-3-O-[3-hydroxymyristoyl] N-acetylglucosamine deacetylase/3-hydroxyacyl-ACP dehydratase [bacterium]|nr:bifunctional UDP-3-O-[3-hydroxymyristoyl] N-acetylglucosamine deacetylase/3-hydroxyacyl-ACP dehydratase [bacterium]
MMQLQTTISNKVSCAGIGLHTGNKTTICFKPADENTGIKFIRKDLPESPVVKADISGVVDTARGTSLGKSDIKVHTVEHVLAAAAGLGIDNMLVELSSNEPPVLDGSALPFVEALEGAKLVQQKAAKKFFEVKEPVWVSENGSSLVALPSKDFRISFTIDYNHPVLNSQFASVIITPKSFKEEIASARTFCFLEEVEMLQKEGLIKGGSLENAVVIGDEALLNDKLRFENEFVMHKILDLIGDLYLLGQPLKAHVIAIKSGHSLNIELVKRLKKMRGLVDDDDTETKTSLNIDEIKKILPHRYPFLLIDRITKIEGDEKIVGIKNVTANESFFQGHFPDYPIMPGVLIVEAMAQVGGILLLRKKENRGKTPFFAKMDNVKLRRPVRPGDQLVIEVEVIKAKSRVGRIMAKASVNREIVCEAELTSIIQ